jgi:16S rRNA (guanine966-N2)-methyltransferase
VRIIAGDFRGRALASVGKGDQAAHLRPTTDRIRESLFNIVSSGRFDDTITDARVLDLFAGTGALGLEAMSRGAEFLCCVEMGSKSLSILHKNIEICGVSEHTQVKKMDATRLPKCDTAPYSLIFLDPPYRKGLGEKALLSAARQGWIEQDALIIWEEGSDVSPPSGFRILDQRKFGDTQATFMRYAV